MNKWIIILLLFFSISSCKKSRFNDSVIDINEVEKIKTPPDFLTKSGDIRFSNNHLIVYDLYASDTLVTLFDKNTFELKTKLGVVGSGPNEIKRPGFFNVSIDGSSLWIYDVGRQNLVSYDLSSTEHPQPQSIYKIPKEITMLMQFAQVDKKPSFISQNFMSPAKNSFVQFDIIENNVSYYGKPYRHLSELQLGDYMQQYQYSFAYSPLKNKAIRSYTHYDLIQLIDKNGEIINEYKGEKFEKIAATALQGYYRRIRFTESYIYCEYIGGNILNETGDAVNYAQKIRIFDWDLNLINTLKLSIPINSFDIDTENNRIVVYTYDESHPLQIIDFDESNL